MSRRWRRLVASVVLVAVSMAGCGLDDGARVRNQENVRDSDSATVDG
jgi:hypothetical protein